MEDFAEQKRRDGELKHRDFELDMERLKFEQQNLASARANSQPPSGGHSDGLKMKDLRQIFKTEENIGLFLVNLERTCDIADVREGILDPAFANTPLV